MPISIGGFGLVEGAGMIGGVVGPVPPNLDSHFRYLSGLLLGIGIGFVLCIPRIERSGLLYRTLGFIVCAGGLARLAGVLEDGWPSGGHLLGLGMELGVVPLLMLWQARIARLAREPKG